MLSTKRIEFNYFQWTESPTSTPARIRSERSEEGEDKKNIKLEIQETYSGKHI